MTEPSTTQRDDLAETLNDAVEVFYEPFDWHESTRIAARILAAGYRKPRTITTVEGLDALPIGSVIRADNGEVFEKQTTGPYCDGPHDWQSFEGTFWNGETFVYPVAVLHEPEALDPLAAALADPEGHALVKDIHDRKAEG